MSFELEVGMLLNTQFGVGRLVKLPEGQAPEKLILDQPQIPVPPPLPESRDRANSFSKDDPLPFSEEQPVVTYQESKKAPLTKRVSQDLSEALNQVRKLETQYKYPYSNDERLVEVDLGYCIVHAPIKTISNVQILLIKTLFTSRYYYMAIVPLTYTIDQLKSLIAEGSGQNVKMLHNIKLINPISGLNEYKTQRVHELRLRDYSQLIFMAQQTFTWDPIKKGKGLTLSNGNLTVNKQGESDYQTVLGTLAMSSGRHYWEIKVEKYVDEEDIFVGVAKKDIDLYVQPNTTQIFYGYMCLCAKKFGEDGQIQNYGYAAKVNDIIGVYLEFKSGLGTLSFFRNGAKCGEAFNNLTGPLFPALSMFYGEVQVTLDPKASVPA